jgi:Antitoxin VbhA
VLDRFRNGDRIPEGVGSHRKTEAVMVPVEVYDELIAERSGSMDQAAGSLRAEGLTASPEATVITEQWASGEITTREMRQLVRRLHGIQ